MKVKFVNFKHITIFFSIINSPIVIGAKENSSGKFLLQIKLLPNIKKKVFLPNFNKKFVNSQNERLEEEKNFAYIIIFRF